MRCQTTLPTVSKYANMPTKIINVPMKLVFSVYLHWSTVWYFESVLGVRVTVRRAAILSCVHLQPEISRIDHKVMSFEVTSLHGNTFHPPHWKHVECVVEFLHWDGFEVAENCCLHVLNGLVSVSSNVCLQPSKQKVICRG